VATGTTTAKSPKSVHHPKNLNAKPCAMMSNAVSRQRHATNVASALAFQ
jgi:hypothetical protein